MTKVTVDLYLRDGTWIETYEEKITESYDFAYLLSKGGYKFKGSGLGNAPIYKTEYYPNQKKVNIILDMLLQKTHQNWLEDQTENGKKDLAKLIQDLVFYKKALKQNVAPQMVAEAALVKAQISNINIQEIL